MVRFFMIVFTFIQICTAMLGINIVSEVHNPSSLIESFLLSELSSASAVHQSLLSLLIRKNINIRDSTTVSFKARISERVAVSSSENPIECRISLGKAVDGSICVAPCSCTGSQKWVMFSELNKMRRRDPNHWTRCQTCQETIDYAPFLAHNNVIEVFVSKLLDEHSILRWGITSALLTIGYLSSFFNLFERFLVSGSTWNMVKKFSYMVIIY